MLQWRCAERLPESVSLIIAAHFMMLKDPKFIDRMAGMIQNGVPASRAVRKLARAYSGKYDHTFQRRLVRDVLLPAAWILKGELYNPAAGLFEQGLGMGRRYRWLVQ